jgi:uncharacterized membrane protein YjjP (DUF1212 family)
MMWIYAAICVVGFFVNIFVGNDWIIWIPMIFASVYAMTLRVHIARKENINECGANPACGECCVGFWCWYCSVTQSKYFQWFVIIIS